MNTKKLLALLDKYNAVIQGTGGNCTANLINCGDTYILITDGDLSAVTVSNPTNEIWLGVVDSKTGDVIDDDGMFFHNTDRLDEFLAKHTSA